VNPRLRAFLHVGLLLVVLGLLLLIFPRAFGFVEMAARELRYLWWLVLIVLLAVWFIWGIGRKPKP
jgi:hypothetical protein